MKIIMGAAKSGKTTEIIQRMKTAANNGEQVLLIVPEQASFANERRIGLEFQGCADKVQVMSFSRLAERISQNLGSAGKPNVTPTAQALMMSIALDEVSDSLEVYKKSCYTKGFIEQMLSVVKEFQNAGVTPEKLSIASLPELTPSSKAKIKELALIFDSFNAILAQSYTDPCAAMENAAEKLLQSDMFSGVHIFIDDFNGFTAPELDMIAALQKNAAEIEVAFCGDDEEHTAAFALCYDTERQLRKIAEQGEKEVLKTVLTNSYYESDELCAIEKAQRFEVMPKCGNNGGAVSAKLCGGICDELETVAAEIKRLSAEGMRYRDIAVIARSLSRYSALISSIFERYDIPFFLDENRDARCSLLTNGILSAIKAACRKNDADWLEIARSPLLGLEMDKINTLENYCYVWSIKFSEWKRPFSKNPSGLVDGMTDDDKALLKELNILREKITAPIFALENSFKSGKGKDIAEGIWNYLETIKAAENISLFAEGINGKDEQDTANARRAFLDEQDLLWQQMIELLELFASLDEAAHFESSRIYELFDLAFGGFEVAIIPRTLDEVNIGTANRMRCENAKAVFIIGAVEGEFPAAAISDGLINESERKVLCAAGMELLNDSDRTQNTEKMFCYRAVSAASHRLFVTCPKKDFSGEELLPSEIFARAKQLDREKEHSALDRVWTIDGLKHAMAENAKNKSAEGLIAAGKEILGEERAAAVISYEKPKHRIENTKVLDKLYGDTLSISPSRLEQFYKCPFSYFMQKGLRAKKLSKADLSPANSGVLIHRILEKIVNENKGNFESLNDDTLKTQIYDEAAAYIKECSPEEGQLPARMRGNIDLLCESLFSMIKNLVAELSQSEFAPAAFELEIKRGGSIEPKEFFALCNGLEKKIYVEGTVDRADTASVNGKNYLRVIDYKSGTKKFDISEVHYGLNLQMLIYLFSIIDNGTDDSRFNAADAAGALYLPAKSEYVSVKRSDNEIKVKNKVEEQYRMNGLLLNDEDVLSAMEKDLGGKYIPYKEKGRSKDALYDTGELLRLKQIVYKKITDMAQEVYSGNISAMPLCDKNKSPCEYCDFKAACGFEDGDEIKERKDLKRDEVLKEEDKANGN